jgi:hypothetical protein
MLLKLLKQRYLNVRLLSETDCQHYFGDDPLIAQSSHTNCKNKYLMSSWL